MAVCKQLYLMVTFAAHGQTSVVKAWQLRPSLIWEDGEWIEWSCTGKKEQSHLEVLILPSAFCHCSPSFASDENILPVIEICGSWPNKTEYL